MANIFFSIFLTFNKSATIVKLVFKNTCFKQTPPPGRPEAATEHFSGAGISSFRPCASSGEQARIRGMAALSQAKSPYLPALPAPRITRQGT